MKRISIFLFLIVAISLNSFAGGGWKGDGLGSHKLFKNLDVGTYNIFTSLDTEVSISSHAIVVGNLKVNGNIDTWFAITSSTDEATVIDAGVYVPIVGNWATDKVVGFTHLTGTATYTNSDIQWHLFAVDMTMHASPGNGTNVSIGLSVDGAAPTHTHSENLAGGETDTIGICHAVQLTQNQTVAIFITTDDGDDMVVDNIDFIMWSR